MKTINYLGLAVLTMVTLASCSKDDNNSTPANENEVITTVTTKLVDGLNIITLTSRDLDGDGPNAPVVTVSGTLSADTEYNGTVQFLNETKTPAEDITLEVQEENIFHQLFYQAPSAIGTFTYADTDDNGKPIGLQFKLHTGTTASLGNIIVTLRHQPNKTAAGVSDGDITNAGGSTDAEVIYPIQVVE